MTIKGHLQERPDLIELILNYLKAGKTAKEISSLTGVKVKRIFYLSSKLLKPEDKIDPFEEKYAKAIKMKRSGNFSIAEISDTVGLNTTSLKQKFKSLGLRSTKEQATANYIRRSGNNRYTFGDLRAICLNNNLELISDESDEDLIHDVTKADFWKFKCLWPKENGLPCSNIISPKLSEVYSETTKSCGCIKADISVKNGRLVTKHTFGDIRKFCKSAKMEFLSDEPDDKLIYNVEMLWDFKCGWDGKIFKTNLVKIYCKSVTSCGCMKTNRVYVRNNIAKKTKYTFQDVLDACKKANLKFLAPINPEDKIYNTDNGNWPVKCFDKNGTVWFPDLGSIIYGKIQSCGCVKSGPQNDISAFLISLGVKNVINNDRTLLAPQEIDILCHDYKIAIEYGGLWFHSQGAVGLNYHNEKFLKCKYKGYRLITIFENEWLERPEAVKGYLRSIFGFKSETIGARECEIIDIPSSLANEFNEKHHIQGKSTGGVSIGLFYDNEMIACAIYNHSYNAPGRVFSGRTWSLARYCVKPNVSIPGGLSKIQKRFIEKYSPTAIFTYSDNRWSMGKIYESIGFQKMGESKPSYKYFKIGTQAPLLSKIYGRKNEIFKRHPEWAGRQETEYQLMKEDGYERIWDCGKIKWIMRF